MQSRAPNVPLGCDGLPDLTDDLVQIGRFPVGKGPFSVVYLFQLKGESRQVAAKHFMGPSDVDRVVFARQVRHELGIWKVLDHRNIVPLLGTAFGEEFGLPCAVSEWMPNGTLSAYVGKTELDIIQRLLLAKGVAAGLEFLHSRSVIHGNLSDTNILIDGDGEARLTDFGIADVLGNICKQICSRTHVQHPCALMWAAPELVSDHSRPTVESDIYSFGSIMLFILTGSRPWMPEDIMGLQSRGSQNPPRPEARPIPDYLWTFIEKCWSSRSPAQRPPATRALDFISHAIILESDPPDLTDQLERSTTEHIGAGINSNVYVCMMQRTSGNAKVSVKVLKVYIPMSAEQGEVHKKAFRNALDVWKRMEHDNIVPLLGVATGFEGSLPAVVTPYMSSGTLGSYMSQQDSNLTVSDRLHLLEGISLGVQYLHSQNVVHGDLTCDSILVDATHNARVSDVGLFPVLRMVNDVALSHLVRPNVIRWTAVEFFSENPPSSSTKTTDIYSLGSLMFYVLSGKLPWAEKSETQVLRQLVLGKSPPCLETSGITRPHQVVISRCWSLNRPSAQEVVSFIMQERTKVRGCSGNVGRRNSIPSEKIGSDKSSTTTNHERQESDQQGSRTALSSPSVGQSQLVPIQPSAISLHSTSLDFGDNLSQSSDDQTGFPSGIDHRDKDSQPDDGLPSSPGSSGQSASTSRSVTTNVILLGETGVGKSSIINLVAGKPIADVSPDAEGCTMTSTAYTIPLTSKTVRIFDTAGLQEPVGANRPSPPMEMAFDLITSLTKRRDLHLVLFCMHARRPTTTTQNSYKLFHEFLRAKRVPTALVFTGLERESNMEDWWHRNQMKFKEYGICGVAHVCITAVRDSNGPHTADNKYTESRRKIVELLEDLTNSDAFNMENDNPSDVSSMKDLMTSCGMEPQTARRILMELAGGDVPTYPAVSQAAGKQAHESLLHPATQENHKSAQSGTGSEPSSAQTNSSQRDSILRWSFPSVVPNQPSAQPVAKVSANCTRRGGDPGNAPKLPDTPVDIQPMPTDPRNLGSGQDSSPSSGLPQCAARDSPPSFAVKTSPDDAGQSISTTQSTTNIILFGETGVGKSSVINLIAGKPIAKVSADVDGCTMASTQYIIPLKSKSVRIFDTVCPEEPQMGVNGYLSAIEKAFDLIASLTKYGGVHLLLFCMRGGLITATVQSNYRLFYELLCDKKVPIALVFTGLEREKNMDDWWDRNENNIKRYGIFSVGHACITTVRDNDNEDVKYTESRKKIVDLLENCTDSKNAFKMESEPWVVMLLVRMRSLINRKRNPKQKDTIKILMKRCHMEPEAAKRVAALIKQSEDPAAPSPC